MPFEKGNDGRPKGAKNKKTAQWEALADSITGEQSEKFSQYMEDLWSDDGKSDDQKRKDKETAAELYLKTLEYFKPKQSRIESDVKVEHDPITFVMPKK